MEEENKGGAQTVVVNICGEASPVVECGLNGALLKCLIDTGSKVSLLRHSALDEAMPDWKQKLRRVEQKANLVGITGDTLETVACCEVPVSLGGRHFTARFFICTEKAMLPVAGLIGQNILSEQGIDLLQSKGALSLGGVEIPLLNWTGRVDRTKNHRDWLTTERTTIRLAEEGILPPLSECVLVGQVACEPANGRLGIVETDLVEVSGLAGAYSLVRCSEDGRLPVRIVNTTLQIITSNYLATKRSGPSFPPS